MKRTLVVLAAFAVVALWAGLAAAGEYHSGQTLLCMDCHTMHYSMQHGFAGGAVGSTPVPGGDWLSATGPNQFLLKAPANELCKACHDGRTFAPDVVNANTNPSPTQGRQAGALNDSGGAAPYEMWKGHTLDSTLTPPGFNPAAIGAPDTWYNAANGLECTSCHAQHGPATSYRNLGPYALGAAAASARPTYQLNAANDTSKDVWINLAAYTAGSGDAATFNPFYDTAKVSFNRNDATVVTLKTSNKLATFCAACHANFHGGPGDANIGASAAALDGFIRHPGAQVTIGAAGTQGYGGHSNLTRFVANTTKVKVTTTDYTAYTDAGPMCLTCHKAHGNQNPFSLIFLNRNATSVDEQGGLGASQVASIGTNMRNLCGQCHGQGN